jgi:UrcA family protein
MKKDFFALRTTHLVLASVGALVGVGLLTANVPAVAQQAEQITVVAPREVHHEIVGRTYSGLPVELVSLTRQVSYAGLDLKKQADVAELEKRIHETAKEACKQLDTLYPDLGNPRVPAHQDCVKTAVDAAMVQAKAAIAAAGK